MSIRSLYFTVLVLLFLLPVTKIVAQVKDDSLVIKEDPLLLNKDTIITNDKNPTGENILALDSSAKKFNPKVATLRSLILPGWGQVYNRKYWKIPIIYGALGTTAGVFLYNMKTYRLLRKAVIYRMDSDTSNDHLVDQQFASLSTESLRIYRNSFRQNIDYSVLVFLVFWGLNVVDATVDAHLKGFDVSPNVSMKIRPGFNYLTNSAGLSLIFYPKDKSSHVILPLP